MYTREGNSPLKAGARVRLPYAMPGPHDFGFLGTARAFKSDSITEGRISTKAPESAQNATCVNLDQQGINKTKGEKMKKLLLIALVAIGSLFVPVQRSDAQITVGVGGVGIGFGYPGYRYGYYPYGYGYPYGYYRSYPYYSYYSGPSYYWSNGHRYYRHHRHHHYYRY